MTTISAQLDLASAHGHHIAGTPITYRHGWLKAAADPYSGSIYAHTGANGKLVPGRQALHDRIISASLAGHKPQDRPAATFLGGGPAAGKSTIIKAMQGDSVHVDADDVKKSLPEYGTMLYHHNVQAATYVQRESTNIANTTQKEALKRRYNVTRDSLGDTSYDVMAKNIAIAHKAGYTVTGKYVTVDTDTAVARAKVRAAETGRMIPESFIRETHASVSQIFPQLVADDQFDAAELWDTNGDTPSLVGSKTLGGTWQVHDPQAWQRFLSKGQ